MITDYNEMMSEIRKQYATLPAQNSNGSIKEYEPLSDDDMAGMSESAIQRYEEKAKQGLLFGDSNLRNLYERMMRRSCARPWTATRTPWRTRSPRARPAARKPTASCRP